MAKISYKLNKKSKYKKLKKMDLKDSYNIKKKKDNAIGVIKIYDSELTMIAIKKSLNTHFKKLLELVIAVSEDGDSPDGLLLCLDEAEKFKRELNNKYADFLNKKEKELYLKKLEVIEKELKDKLIIYSIEQKRINNKKVFVSSEKEEIEETRHRSR